MLEKNTFFDKNTILFLTGLLIFTGLNFFSASTTELLSSEAYYWQWAQNPSFGYYNHPPMVAWMIMAGEWLFNGVIGVRLFSVILSSLSLIVIWRLIKNYTTNPLLFWTLIYSIFLIHPFAFLATPETPLLFFTSLFFLYYRKYLRYNSFQNAVLLAFIIALMIYTKYEAFIILIIVVLVNPKLLKRFTFWFIAFHTLIYLTPHIIWQIDHNLPTIHHFVSKCRAISFDFADSLKFMVNTLLAFGPLLGWFLIYILFAVVQNNKWEKSLQFTGLSLIFFQILLTTFFGFSNQIIILVSLVPIFILSYRYFSINPKWQKWITATALFNFVLLLILRILILFPIAREISFLKQFTGNKESISIIEKYTGKNNIIFQDLAIDASLYSFYSENDNVGSVNSAFSDSFRFSNFLPEKMHDKKDVVLITQDSLQFDNPEKIITPNAVYYTKTVPVFKNYLKLMLNIREVKHDLNTLKIDLTIKNPYEETIVLGSQHDVKACFQLWSCTNSKWLLVTETKVKNIEIPSEHDTVIQTEFNLSNKTVSGNVFYLMLKIGECKPIPSKCMFVVK